ncbi:hypothetical protein ACFL7D_04275 [candidate division KSB1 bacterium]
MSTFSYISLIGTFIIIMLLAGIVFFRVRIGGKRKDDPTIQSFRRNTFVILFIIVVFLLFWLNIFAEGRWIEYGITGWKVIAAGFIFATGIASVILIIIGLLRKKGK